MDTSGKIAKVDVSTSKNYILPGRYELIPVGTSVAKMDASIVEINVLSGGYG
jgi:hypothetical protein